MKNRTNEDGVSFRDWLACFNQALLEHTTLGIYDYPDVRTMDLFESDCPPGDIVDEYSEASLPSYIDRHEISRTANRKYEALIDSHIAAAEKLAEKREALMAEKARLAGSPNFGQRVDIEVSELSPCESNPRLSEWIRTGASAETRRGPDAITSASYSDVTPRESGEYFIHNSLQGSDYSGGILIASNIDCWLEEVDPDRRFSVELYGGYGSRGVAVNLRTASKEAIEALAALCDYPTLSEDHYSDAQVEAENEAWESYVAEDFCRELGIEFSPTTQSDGTFELFSFFDEAREAANEYWEDSDEGIYIRLEPIVAKACFLPLPDGSSCRHCEADLSGKTTASHESECPL